MTIANILSIGNVFKVAWRIYRTRFTEYYRLAIIGSAWIFVPIYGWAKYAAMMGLISRLAYGELTGNPESVREARRQIKPKMWFFFSAGVKGTFIFVLYGLAITFLLLFSLHSLVNVFVTQFGIKNFWIFGNAIVLLFSYGWYLLHSRLFLYELPLGLQENTRVFDAMDTGWHLVEDYMTPTQITIFLFSFVSAFFNIILFKISNITQDVTLISSIFHSANISTLISSIIEGTTFLFFGAIFIPFFPAIASIFLRVVFNPFYEPNANYILTAFSLVFFLAINISLGALLIPFYQSLKAVIYRNLMTN